MEANTDRNAFALTRFANVAHSNGSVLPFWINLFKEGKTLKLFVLHPQQDLIMRRTPALFKRLANQKIFKNFGDKTPAAEIT